MLPERRSGNEESGRNRQADLTQADKTHSFWPNHLFINETSGIQWNNVNLTNNKSSLQMMHSFVRLQDFYYAAIIS